MHDTQDTVLQTQIPDDFSQSLSQTYSFSQPDSAPFWAVLHPLAPGFAIRRLVHSCCIIGRSTGNPHPATTDVVTLKTQQISAQHCKIVRSVEHGDKVFIVDTRSVPVGRRSLRLLTAPDSTNGTFVNKQRVPKGERWPLHTRDTITFVYKHMSDIVKHHDHGKPPSIVVSVRLTASPQNTALSFALYQTHRTDQPPSLLNCNDTDSVPSLVLEATLRFSGHASWPPGAIMLRRWST